MKKIFTFLMAFLLCLSVCPAVLAQTTDGFFVNDSTVKYQLEKRFDAVPNTFEATVWFPADTSSSTRGGVIIGNYASTVSNVNFEVYTSGQPRLYWVDEDLTIKSWTFSKVNLYTGNWHHVAIVRDAATRQVHCYLDGELKQTLAYDSIGEISLSNRFVLGGDLRPGNLQTFKGKIKNVALYSDARTASEIASDVTKPGTDNLLCLFETAENSDPNVRGFVDSSPNANHAIRRALWLKDKEPVTDYAYSFVVVGDTQKVSYVTPEKFATIYEWIVDNVEDKNIKFVFGLGDITDKNRVDEWEVCMEGITKMDGVVPYSLVRGNHDGVDRYNQYVPYSKYSSLIGGSYEENMLNVWYEFTVGDIKYINICFDYGPSDEVLAWAGEVIEAHPNHNVIITTHAYLYRDGTTLDDTELCPPSQSGPTYNDGDDMWEKLIRKHPNITLVLSGHDPCETVVSTQTKGDHGNIVTQMLIDPQETDGALGSTGLVAIFYMSEDGRILDIEYYSTIRDEYYLEENQYRIELDVMDPDVHLVKAEPTSEVINIAPGGKTDITYSITRNQGWNSMKLELSYDNSAIKLSGDKNGGASAGYTWDIGSDLASSIGTVTANVADLGGTSEDGIFLVEGGAVASDVIAKGEFITFHIEIPADAEPGEYTFDVDVNDAVSVAALTNTSLVCDVDFEPVTLNIGFIDERLAVEGAQIRLPSEAEDIAQGLRFVSAIDADIMKLLDRADYPESQNDTGIGFGTVVLPTAILGENELKKDTTVSYGGREFSAKVVPAAKLYSENSQATWFTAVMTGVSESNYTTEYTVTPYITYENDNGDEITLYGLSYSTSVFKIAVAAYNDESVDEYVKEYLVEEILSKVDPDTYHADGGWSDIYRPM